MHKKTDFGFCAFVTCMMGIHSVGDSLMEWYDDADCWGKNVSTDFRGGFDRSFSTALKTSVYGPMVLSCSSVLIC